MAGGGDKSILRYLITALLMPLFLVACAHQKPKAPLEGPLSATIRTYPSPAQPETEDPPQADALQPGDEFLEEDLDFLEDDFFDEDLEEEVLVADPLAFWNKMMFTFNDTAYFLLLKPLAQGYGFLVPRPIRVGVKNFFINLIMPIRLVNCVLQGKPEAAAAEMNRFVLNSTVGVLGIMNPAAKYPELNPSPEDTGQTLAVWGFGNGFYIVWPFLGSSSLRDSVGLAGDFFLSPVTHLGAYYGNRPLALGARTYRYFNALSLRIGDYETFKDAAIEPYDAFRDAYIQHRNSRIKE
jgi:phospholipid-binding lipoprotein MlaA